MIIRVKRGDPLACLVPVQIYTMRPTRTIITYAYNSLKIWDAFRRCASEKSDKGSADTSHSGFARYQPRLVSGARLANTG